MRGRLASLVLVLCACKTAPSPDTVAPIPVTETPAVEPEEAAFAFSSETCHTPRAMLGASRRTELSLEHVEVRTRAEGPLARTTMTMEVATETGMGAVEAFVTLMLPEGAVFRDMKLSVRNQWQEASVVPREVAREVYSGIVRHDDDPALAEQDETSWVRIRVFPLTGRGNAKVQLAWVTPLPDDAMALEIPLCGLPKIGSLHAHVAERVGDRWTERERKLYFVDPSRRFYARLDGGRADAVRQGDMVAARVVGRGKTADAPVEALTVLVDTSASQRPTYGRQIARLAKLLDALPGSVPLQVVAFDQTVDVLGSRSVADAPSMMTALGDRGALGASDVRLAVETLASLRPHARVLVLSDGVATLGDLDMGPDPGLVRRLAAAGVERVDVLASDGRVPPLLEDLAHLGSKPGRVLSALAPEKTLRAALQHESRVVALDVPGAEFVSPRRWVDDGDAEVVFARLGAGAAWSPRVTGGALGPDEPVETTTDDLLVPMVAAAEVAQLQRDLDGLPPKSRRAKALAQRITKLAVHHGLLTPMTASLALESEQDWRDNGVDKYRHVQEFRKLEPEAKRLVALERQRERWERRYLLAVERWAHRRAAGLPVGPRPTREDFARVELHNHAHDAAGGWSPDTRNAEEMFIAGGRRAQKNGDHALAERWFASTIDIGSTAGLYFLDPASDVFARLLARVDDPPPHPAELAALARGESPRRRHLPTGRGRLYLLIAEGHPSFVLENDKHRIDVSVEHVAAVTVHREGRTRNTRALIIAGGHAIGVLYVIDGDRVTHHPFVFSGHERTEVIDLP